MHTVERSRRKQDAQALDLRVKALLPDDPREGADDEELLDKLEMPHTRDNKGLLVAALRRLQDRREVLNIGQDGYNVWINAPAGGLAHYRPAAADDPMTHELVRQTVMSGGQWDAVLLGRHLDMPMDVVGPVVAMLVAQRHLEWVGEWLRPARAGVVRRRVVA